jgi:hypothetical protein
MRFTIERPATKFVPSMIHLPSCSASTIVSPSGRVTSARVISCFSKSKSRGSLSTLAPGRASRVDDPHDTPDDDEAGRGSARIVPR